MALYGFRGRLGDDYTQDFALLAIGMDYRQDALTKLYFAGANGTVVKFGFHVAFISRIDLTFNIKFLDFALGKGEEFHRTFFAYSIPAYVDLGLGFNFGKVAVLRVMVATWAEASALNKAPYPPVKEEKIEPDKKYEPGIVRLILNPRVEINRIGNGPIGLFYNCNIHFISHYNLQSIGIESDLLRGERTSIFQHVFGVSATYY